jgi:GxxExxY protein
MDNASELTRSTRSTRRFSDHTSAVIGAALSVHRALGPGLLESAYEACLTYELTELGLRVRTQVPLPIVYKGIRLDAGYRLDMLVEDEVVVEIKAIEKLERVHFAQVLSYLRLSGRSVGLLINFNVSLLKQGVHRIVNALRDP